MTKPSNLRDLLISGHLTRGEIERVARYVLDGKTLAELGPEGYVVTACNYDDLPKREQDYAVKLISLFHVENILDAAEVSSDGDDVSHYAAFGPDGDE